MRKGDRVIIFQGDWCGQCHACRNGLSPTYCTSNLHPKQGQTRVAMAGIQDINDSESGGWAMARYRIAAEAHCYRIPDALDFKHAQAANCSVGVGWSNQEMMNGPDHTAVEVDDYVFLRPTQSESVMLQFGDLFD